MARKPSKGKAAGKPGKSNVKQQPKVEQTPAAPTAPEGKPNLEAKHVKEAISQGQALIKEGKSKADAARAMYQQLRNEDKELIVAAFVKGATLTEKGALTYWYNCRRQAQKETKSTS